MEMLKRIRWGNVFFLLGLIGFGTLIFRLIFVPFGPKVYDINLDNVSTNHLSSVFLTTSDDTTRVLFEFTSPSGKRIKTIGNKSDNVWNSGSITFDEKGEWFLKIDLYSTNGKTTIQKNINLGECKKNDDCLNNEYCNNGNCEVLVCSSCEEIIDHECKSTCPKGELCCDGSCFSPNICMNNSDCNDNNPNTIDVCLNPGKCGNACSNKEITCPDTQILCNGVCKTPFCFTDDDCYDDMDNTYGKCLRAGSCTASCSFERITCEPPKIACNGRCVLPVCSSDSDCNANENGFCNNSATCNAECVYCRNGETLCDGKCTKICFNDADCDDGSYRTNDYCINSGSCGSICLHCGRDEIVYNNECHKIECKSNRYCKNGEVCLNPGEINSKCCSSEYSLVCNNECTNPACNSDSDCGENEVCVNPGTCDAECSPCPSGTVYHDGECITPECFKPEDCIGIEMICENPGEWNAKCKPCNTFQEIVCDNKCVVPVCKNDLTCEMRYGKDYYCKNPNSCNAKCVKKCKTDSDCDDGNDETNDYCVNDGKKCLHCDIPALNCNDECVVPKCFSDEDCASNEVCENPGTCDAVCIKDLSEINCESNDDCNDFNDNTVDMCRRVSFSSEERKCFNIEKFENYCGDGICSDWERSMDDKKFTCMIDCNPKIAIIVFMNEQHDTDYLLTSTEGEDYDFLELLFNDEAIIQGNDAMTRHTILSIHSLNYVPLFYNNEASAYGVNLGFSNNNFEILGPFIANDVPRLGWNTDENVLTEYFVPKAENEGIDLNNYDIVNFVYIEESGLGDIPFRSVSYKKYTFTTGFTNLAREVDDLVSTLIHELTHSFGAVDYYQGIGACVYPDGYYEPNKEPLYPQDYACLMCKSLPTSENGGRKAKLSETKICESTAKKIGWINDYGEACSTSPCEYNDYVCNNNGVCETEIGENCKYCPDCQCFIEGTTCTSSGCMKNCETNDDCISVISSECLVSSIPSCDEKYKVCNVLANCCGNLLCEEGEDASNCPKDCFS